MAVKRITRWRIQVNRTNGSVEFDRIRSANIRDLIKEMKGEGKKPSIDRIEPLVIEFIVRRDLRLGIKSRIESMILEPDND